jgi:hypothetical protein
MSNIKMDFKELKWEGVVWNHLAQDRNIWQAVVNTEFINQLRNN